MSYSPFDYINSITHTKVDLMVDPEAEKAYTPFMVNRGLSYFADTVMYANEMNKSPSANKRMQYDFLRLGIRKKKRFSKWDKKVVSPTVKMLSEYYDCSVPKAEAMESLHTKEQLEHIKTALYRGGKKKR